MKNPKIIGLICAWGCENWIKYSIQQALEYCDDVFVNISAHSSILNKYEDSTYNVTKGFGKDINLIDLTFEQSNHAVIKSSILNYMSNLSEHFKVGNWIWILDFDEFYVKDGYNTIKDIMKYTDFNEISVEDYYFYINMSKYLKGDHPRLFKIEDINMNPSYRFYPTQNWPSHNKKQCTLVREIGMRHYGMLMNPNMKLDMWKTEYPGKTQDNKTKWIDYIYRNYDLNNEDYWILENEKLFGIKSPWFSNSYVPNKDGKLFVYTGEIPTVLKDSGFDKINDFRKTYNFI